MTRRLWVVLATLLLAAAATACGGDDAPVVSTSGQTQASSATTFTTTLVNGKPHFDTPEEAMRYLAVAWNADDTVSLKHVTDPSARDELDAMHGVAVNLRLKHCDKNPIGDYTCYFSHDYPPHPSTTLKLEHQGHTGEAVFIVGPADTPGWYMTVLESCS